LPKRCHRLAIGASIRGGPPGSQRACGGHDAVAQGWDVSTLSRLAGKGLISSTTRPARGVPSAIWPDLTCLSDKPIHAIGLQREESW